MQDFLSDTLLFGRNREEGLVAAELVQTRRKRDEIALFFRRGTDTVRSGEAFSPFVLVDGKAFSGGDIPASECPQKFYLEKLEGKGRLNARMVFLSWSDCLKAKTWLGERTGESANSPQAPYLFINDPIRQHFCNTGRTLFKGMSCEQLRRMQVDIECVVSEGFEFCNAEREGDRIVAIGLGDQTGWTQILSGSDTDEEQLLSQFVAAVQERDPDVIEGHNIFNFDLSYILARARRHGVKLALGRDGSVPSVRPSRLAMGERTIAYTRFDIFGRHVVDTLFLVQAYDLGERALEGFGLKHVAAHFGLSAPDRTYIDGSEISAVFGRDADRLMRYVRDDVAETRAVSALLSPSWFAQTQMLPFSYQNVCVRGNATKVDALMVRGYLGEGRAVPLPGTARDFAGGYTDIFFQGVARNVHHCDVRSLYPSLMLAKRLGPGSDELGMFLRMLNSLRTYRLDAKKRKQAAGTEQERNHYDALQQTFKILINSFYGYLGFAQGMFNDFAAAEKVTSEGRAVLKNMISAIEKLGAKPIEIDTDGIYFVPPPLDTKDRLEAFRKEFASSLPDGIEIEFDGEYEAMYSYKMKNYALLRADGEILIKGAALRSRGMERFQRSFLRRFIMLRLQGADRKIPELKAEYESAIRDRKWPIEELAKTVTLQDAPSTYAAKVGKGGRARDAAYELALKSGRQYRAGDQLTYYVTGEKKSVAAHESARSIGDWDPTRRDENVPYYLAKLDALYKKFYSDVQGERASPAEVQEEMEM